MTHVTRLTNDRHLLAANVGIWPSMLPPINCFVAQNELLGCSMPQTSELMIGWLKYVPI